MNDKTSFMENYKEYLFYLYNLGQVNRKKNISIIKKPDFEKISLETKRKLKFLYNQLNRATIELDCIKCNKKINKAPFIVCDYCHKIFHEHHAKPVNKVIKCLNCNNRLMKIKIFENEIYISSEKIVKNNISISKIEIQF